ncbi:MAG: sigma-70 family RNA polymerase sigma factor [Planctomycetaceae bacterium]|nr:sigma-70 family RNA polymerase sigma factor [Planctomycetaceae bacterium]
MTTIEGLQVPAGPRPRDMNAENSWSEAALVDGCRAGRRDALEALVSLYQERLHRIAGAMAGADAAADLVQETFLAAVEAFPRFRGDAQLSTWLISILRNRFSLYLRGRKKWRLARLPEEGNRLPAPEPEKVETEVRDVLDRVRELPEEFRTPLVLFHVDGLSYAEIAKAMDCPVGTVRSRLFEARDRLKRLILKADAP